MELQYLLYASQLAEPLGHGALTRLLDASQRENGEAGVSGFLHIKGNVVLQYLEGPPEALLRTMQRIRKDTRHGNFIVLAQNSLTQRYFDGWQMALVESTTLSLFDLLGVTIETVPDVKQANLIDVIMLLSANVSYLRLCPSQAAMQ